MEALLKKQDEVIHSFLTSIFAHIIKDRNYGMLTDLNALFEALQHSTLRLSFGKWVRQFTNVVFDKTANKFVKGKGKLKLVALNKGYL